MNVEEVVEAEFVDFHIGNVLMSCYEASGSYSVNVQPPKGKEAYSPWVIRVMDTDRRRAYRTAIRAYWHSDHCKYDAALEELVEKWCEILADGLAADGGGSAGGDPDLMKDYGLDMGRVDLRLQCLRNYVAGLCDGSDLSSDAWQWFSSIYNELRKELRLEVTDKNSV